MTDLNYKEVRKDAQRRMAHMFGLCMSENCVYGYRKVSDRIEIIGVGDGHIENPDEVFVYMILCGNGAIYTGISKDIEKRYEQHEKGRGAKYTKRFRVIGLLAFKSFSNRSAAMKEEYRIKRELNHHEKRKLAKKWRDEKNDM